MDESAASGGSLQFDRADYGHDAPPTMACGACGREIGSVYFEAGGKTICEMCRHGLEAFQASRPGATGVLKAIGAGFGAAIAGWLLYYAVLKLSGYEFGLIAIVVGWAVGRAVRWGSGGRGGWVYQTMAVAITYITIVSSSVPSVIDAIRAQGAEVPSPAFFAGFVLLLPFLQGFENLMGIAILGFGVFEAWRVNKRLSIVVTGPFSPGRRPGA